MTTVSPVTLNKKQQQRFVLTFGFTLDLSHFSPLPVSDVAGVMDPHQLAGILTPPRRQLQTHLEAVLSFRQWVPPAEPIPCKLSHFLITKKIKKCKCLLLLEVFKEFRDPNFHPRSTLISKFTLTSSFFLARTAKTLV